MAQSVCSDANSRVRGTAILYSYLQIAIFTLTAGYLGYWSAEQHMRAARSWEAIVSRLEPGMTGANLAETIEKLFSQSAIETRARRAHGRRTMFHHAGVMLEMAEYAERNGGAEIAPLIANLRSHARAIRLATAKSAFDIFDRKTPV